MRALSALPVDQRRGRLAATDDRLGAIDDLKLAEDVRDVILYCLDTQRQPLGDLMVTAPLRDQLEDFVLTIAELRKGTWWWNRAEWLLILKVIRPAAEAFNPAAREVDHPIYWKREALAYQSGLLDDLAGVISAPRCLAVEERADESC